MHSSGMIASVPFFVGCGRKARVRLEPDLHCLAEKVRCHLLQLGQRNYTVGPPGSTTQEGRISAGSGIQSCDEIHETEPPAAAKLNDFP